MYNPLLHFITKVSIEELSGEKDKLKEFCRTTKTSQMGDDCRHGKLDIRSVIGLDIRVPAEELYSLDFNEISDAVTGRALAS
jgi:hypothetical protein